MYYFVDKSTSLTPSKYYRYLALLTGVAAALVFWLVNPFDMEPFAAKVLGVGALMIIWWVTEAIPMPAVALLPLILFPLLRIETLENTAGRYADKVIFLFMGGFMLALAIEKWNLHKRIALNIIKKTGTSGNRIILGFIIATGLISMWLSNTATTMMMFPIALSVIHVIRENYTGSGNLNNFSIALMLVIAYASNLAGISTIIGTPPNVAFVGYISDKYNYTVDFVDWMMICTPLAIILCTCLYFVVTRVMFRNRIQPNIETANHVNDELSKMGPFSRGEKRVLAIFLMTAMLWITKDLINAAQSAFKLDDSIIALIGGVSLFICPSGESDSPALLDWSDTKNLAWGILLLFGGGIALASGLEKAGLIQDLGTWLAQFAGSEFLVVFLVCLFSLFISEVMSNVAQVIVFSPVVASLADAMGMNPLLLGIPMTLAASCAGMLPMGTPPNAIAFSSGHIRLKDMTRAGLVMNIISVVVITVVCYLFLPMIFGRGTL